MNVLVLSGGGFQGLAIVKSLLFYDSVKIVLADSNKYNITQNFSHKFYEMPMIRNRESFILALENICDSEKIDLVFPSTMYEMPILSALKIQWQDKKTHICIPEKKIINIFSDKKLTLSFLKKNKLESLPNILEPDKELGLGRRLIAKSRYGWGGKDIYFLNTLLDLKIFDFCNNRKKFIFQQWVNSFEEYSVDFSINVENKVSPWIIRKREQVCGGFAIFSQLIQCQAISLLMNKFLNAINLYDITGLWNIQFMKVNERYYISDVNVRVGTSSPLSIGLGVNILKNFFDNDVICFDSSDIQKKGTYSIRYLEELTFTPAPKNILGIVFDLDDTLLDHKLWLGAKLNEFIINNPSIFKSHDKAKLIGLQLIEEGRWDTLIDDLLKKCQCADVFSRSHMYEQWKSISPKGSFLFSNVTFVLQELIDRGYKLSLLTDNPPETQQQKIEVTGISKYFDTILYCQSLGVEKPEAVLFDEISNRMAISKRNLAMIGDNLFSDIDGAMHNGFKCSVLVQTDGIKNLYSPSIKKIILDKYNETRMISSISHLLNIFI